MEKIPKIFISYSWTTPEHQEKVINLASRLMSHGVEVILDKWDLKEGQDKYAFMEQSVINPEIDRVLIICDSLYAKKANNRIGGVGEETIIISPEIYGSINHEKFIPVVFEYDQEGKPCLPTYIKSRIYIDLSTDERYEMEYEKLVRNIHDKPMYKKPAIGKPPEWIIEEASDYSALRDIIRQINQTQAVQKGKFNALLRRFVDAFNEKINEMKIDSSKKFDAEMVIDSINKTKDLRDVFLIFLDELILSDADLSGIIKQFFESTYNNIFTELDRTVYYEIEFDHLRFLLWEMLILSVVILLHNERYEDIKKIIATTYFLKNGLNREEVPADFTEFRPYLKSVEEVVKPKSKNPGLFSLTAEILMGREKLPLLTKARIVEADVLLCQLSYIHLKNHMYRYWFPSTYIYIDNSGFLWKKLVSRTYCEKTMSMYGASSIDELKKIAEECNYKREMKYSYSINAAPSIAATININDIGSMP